MSTDFSRILNWRLLAGSHEFPGPDGGTCINEAAIVVAGLPYRAISSVQDLPPCFSRILGRFAIWMNDGMPDDIRQRLKQYVMRLPGTADDEDIEASRQCFLEDRIAERLGFPSYYEAIFTVPDIFGRFEELATDEPSMWFYAMAVFDQALAMGRQAKSIDIADVRARAEKAKKYLAHIYDAPTL